MYSGHQCEFAAQVSCEIGAIDSTYAFCTNGGACPTQVKPGEKAPHCDCDANFEGKHCQYAKGTRPTQENAFPMPSSTGDDSLSGGAIFGIIAICLVVGLGGAVYYMQRKGTLKSSFKLPNHLDAKPEPNIKEGVEEANADFI